MIYSVVQTGPKTQFGGVKAGLLSVAYHVGIDDMVYNDPIVPARNGRAKQRAKRAPDRSMVLSIVYQGKRSSSNGMNVMEATYIARIIWWELRVNNPWCNLLP
jgi:hypothetical protein